MNNKLEFLNSIKNQVENFVEASTIIAPDKNCDFHTLVIQYSANNLNKVRLDLSFISDTIYEKKGFGEIQVFINLIENYKIEYFRDLVWTVNKLNYILPSGQLNINNNIESLFFKQTYPINLKTPSESQCFSVSMSLQKTLIILNQLMPTLKSVASGALPSKALKLNPWSHLL